MYEAMFLFGLWVNHSLRYGGDIRDGVGWLDFTKNRSFPGTYSYRYTSIHMTN